MTAASLPESFGFCGLGAMGLPMAINLRKFLPRETILYIYDVIEAPMEALEVQASTLGPIARCRSPREVCERAQCILTIVPEGKHVKALYLDSKDSLSSIAIQGKYFIDCSTIDTASSAQVAKAIQSARAHFFDAPVSGGVIGAEKGTLTFMMGISPQDPHLPLLQTILSSMGTNLFPCGGPTLGLTAKLCNNYVSGIIAIATSEGMNLGIRHGMDPKVLSSIFTVSTAGSVINDKFNPVPGVVPTSYASNGYKPGFKVQLMRKDFALAVESAKQVGVNLALGESGLAVYTGASQDPRCVDLDSRVVYRYLGGKE